MEKLHNEKLHNLYSSPNIIMEDAVGRSCSKHKKGMKNFGQKTWREETT